MDLDDPAADGLEIYHAGVALEMLPAPCAAPLLDRWLGRVTNLPIVEGAVTAGDTTGMAPPVRRAVDDRDVAADVLALEQGRPHMAGLIGVGIVVGRRQEAAAHAHAFEIVDRLGENRIILRSDAVRRGLEPLAQRDCELVVDPAMRWIPHPRVAVLSGNENVVRASRTLEILSAPRVDLANRHLHLSRYRRRLCKVSARPGYCNRLSSPYVSERCGGIVSNLITRSVPVARLRSC